MSILSNSLGLGYVEGTTIPLVVMTGGNVQKLSYRELVTLLRN